MGKTDLEEWEQSNQFLTGSGHASPLCGPATAPVLERKTRSKPD